MSKVKPGGLQPERMNVAVFVIESVTVSVNVVDVVVIDVTILGTNEASPLLMALLIAATTSAI